MSGAAAQAREDLLGKIMAANSLLLKMREYAAQATPSGQDFFVELLPHLEVVLSELAEHVFFAPPSVDVTAAHLRELMLLRQEQTLDIYRFEAYRYLLARIC